MPADGISPRSEAGLTVLKPSAYDSEAILQTALADHPEGWALVAHPSRDGIAERPGRR